MVVIDVISCRHDFKVFNSIVSLDAISMVNNFIVRKIATEMSLHNRPMLWSIVPVNANVNIPTTHCPVRLGGIYAITGAVSMVGIARLEGCIAKGAHHRLGERSLQLVRACARAIDRLTFRRTKSLTTHSAGSKLKPLRLDFARLAAKDGVANIRRFPAQLLAALLAANNDLFSSAGARAVFRALESIRAHIKGGIASYTNNVWGRISMCHEVSPNQTFCGAMPRSVRALPGLSRVSIIPNSL